MSIHDQRIVHLPPGRMDEAARHILGAGAKAIAAHGGHIFGLFKGVIGLSHNRAVVVTEWPDETAAKAHAGLAVDGLAGATLVDHDIWEPTSRPLPGEVPQETGGFYSHRAFDIMERDWRRFRELSERAWGEWEGTHAARVTGLWKCRNRPAPGQVRIRLMAWYESLDAWERSRWWNAGAKPSPEAYARFRERNALTQDTHVAILGRIALPA